MLVYLLLIGITFNSSLAAILNAKALPPKNATLTYYSAVLYARKTPGEGVLYEPLKVYCGAALISPKWLLTNKNCPVDLKWNVLLGVGYIPRRAVHRKNKYNLRRMISSLESLLTLLELTKRVDTEIAKPVTIEEFVPFNMTCVVLSWMSIYTGESNSSSTTRIIRQLQCEFEYHIARECLDIAKKYKLKFNSSDMDICLLQKNENDSVLLCSSDIGAPFVCDGTLVGNIYFFPNSGHCIRNTTDLIYPVSYIYPEIDWVNYFIAERISSSVCLCMNLYLSYMCIIGIKFFSQYLTRKFDLWP